MTQGRLQERVEQPGHLYFDGFNLHSSHKTDVLLFGLVGGASSGSSMERERERRLGVMRERAGLGFNARVQEGQRAGVYDRFGLREGERMKLPCVCRDGIGTYRDHQRP